jgi:hypothetical protein
MTESSPRQAVTLYVYTAPPVLVRRSLRGNALPTMVAKGLVALLTTF